MFVDVCHEYTVAGGSEADELEVNATVGRSAVRRCDRMPLTVSRKWLCGVCWFEIECVVECWELSEEVAELWVVGK